MFQPKAAGTQYFHYQDVYKELGTRKAKATPSESGVSWYYFVGVAIDKIHEWMQANGIERVDTNCEHDCSGKYFARNPSVHTVGNRTLVSQSWGYDI
jgi:hypothetical protein